MSTVKLIFRFGFYILQLAVNINNKRNKNLFVTREIMFEKKNENENEWQLYFEVF